MLSVVRRMRPLSFDQVEEAWEKESRALSGWSKSPVHHGREYREESIPRRRRLVAVVPVLDMPEGDTIFRTATTIRSWLGNRRITGATSRNPHLGVGRLIGRTLVDVSAHGKHLFMEFEGVEAGADGPVPDDARLVLRTHMMMSGSWHVYGGSDRWHRPARQAVVTLVAGERVAVCFNAPVVELLPKRWSVAGRATADIGPDILAEPIDVDEIGRRIGNADPTMAVGVALLDQHIVAGIGNIYRCESLFEGGVNPRLTLAELRSGRFLEIVSIARRQMRANLGAGNAVGGSREGVRAMPAVYRRTGRPCRTCGTSVVSERLGRQPRTVYWCPRCQPR